MPWSMIALKLFCVAFLTGIAILMVKRNLRNTFPVYFTYILFQIISAGGLMYAFYYANENAYFYAYYTANGLSGLLGLMIVYEMFSYSMRPYVGLRDMAKMLFQWVVLFILLISAVVAFGTAGSTADHIVTTILTIERCVRLLQCGLLLFLLCCSSYLGLSWKSFPIGVGFGFGLVASSNLIFVGLRGLFDPQWTQVLDVIRGFSYDGALVIWLGYCLAPQSMRARTELLYRPSIDRWNQSAMAIQYAGGFGRKPVQEETPATYISDIEHAVEDAMKRAKNH